MNKLHLSRFIFNLPGWRTNKKIIVIESDDWGSIRMPSKEVYQKFLKAGYRVDKHPYERYDSLASEDDLELLFDLLTSFKDTNGHHPVITANSLVTNPDFEKIESDNFKNYYYELITETFKKYPRHRNNFSLWKQGMDAKVFHPQFHGREHLNVSVFMEALQKGDRDVHFGFANRILGSIPFGPEAGSNFYVRATQYHSHSDKMEKLNFLLEGLDLFEKLFGYKSESIMPTNHTWSLDFNDAVIEKGVKFIQGLRKLRQPIPGEKDFFHNAHQGKKISDGLTHLVRNGLFEPSLSVSQIKDPVNHCLLEMSIAFGLNKPFIIGSHRINYIGNIDPGNRDKNLRMLHKILSKALKRWPDIEFKTSDQVGNMIIDGNRI